MVIRMPSQTLLPLLQARQAVQARPIHLEGPASDQMPARIRTALPFPFQIGASGETRLPPDHPAHQTRQAIPKTPTSHLTHSSTS